MPIGQLLVKMLQRFRGELYRRGQAWGYPNIRLAHLQVFGNIDWTGTRLTDLAARADMTRPSMSELVDELERAGYLERRPDPTDRRAKLICLTHTGRRVIVLALRAVREIERGYSAEVGARRFAEMCQTRQTLVNAEDDSLPPAEPDPPTRPQGGGDGRRRGEGVKRRRKVTG